MIERRSTMGGPTSPAVSFSSGGTRITGYAAVYYDGSPGSEYRMGDGITERIMPGAFDSVVSGKPDVRALFNHDPNFPLGRTSAGTLALIADKRGLRYAISLPSSRQDIAEAIARGDVSGSSFSFSIGRGGERFRNGPGDSLIREISGFGDLFDVGPVTFPAYSGTSAGV